MCSSALPVKVPETAVDEYRLPLTPEYDVGRPRQVRGVKAITMAERRQQLPDRPFGPCVRRLDCTHYIAALLWRNLVGHG
jgi:hypothetical protein